METDNASLRRMRILFQGAFLLIILSSVDVDVSTRDLKLKTEKNKKQRTLLSGVDVGDFDERCQKRRRRKIANALQWCQCW